jgi:predicted 3-demethylubiquinone-9 3-methyltransferase (glyoxalase superfamily)
MQKIVTFLTFNNQAEEAANFYVSLFKDSKVNQVMRYGEAGPGQKGAVMSASFTLNGQPFMALNGGPSFTFSQGISLFINCDTQEEVDRLWEQLSEGGSKGRCGWLKDRYGVSWQVIPTTLGQLLHQKDAATSRKVMEAMMKMDKIDTKKLKEAAEG